MRKGLGTMETFVILRGGEEIGVFTHPQLREKVQKGEVLPTDEMQRTGSEDKYVVSTVPSLAVFLDKLTDGPPTSESYGMVSDSSDMSGAAMESPSIEMGDDSDEDEKNSTDDLNEISEDAFDSAVASAVHITEKSQEKIKS
jgi:hypothetical protein